MRLLTFLTTWLPLLVALADSSSPRMAEPTGLLPSHDMLAAAPGTRLWAKSQADR